MDDTPKTPPYPFDEPGKVDNPSSRARRQWLKGGIGTLIAAALGYFAWTKLVLPPAPDRPRVVPAGGDPVGKAAKFSETTPTGLTAAGQNAFVVNNGGHLTIFKNYCTHQGCALTWTDKQNQFVCPCHDSIFNKDGSVAQGPAGRPLIVIPSHVQGDTLYADG